MKALLLTTILSLFINTVYANGTITGFDFDGLQIRTELPAGMACPMIASLEADACYKIGGDTAFDENCNTLCSFPIAPKGMVSGFDFNGLQLRAELPDGIACPAIATAESIACYKIGGNTAYDENCNNLCTLPISE